MKCCLCGQERKRFSITVTDKFKKTIGHICKKCTEKEINKRLKGKEFWNEDRRNVVENWRVTSGKRGEDTAGISEGGSNPENPPEEHKTFFNKVGEIIWRKITRGK